MKRIALLIGVSEYNSSLVDLKPLPSAIKDVKELEKLLRDKDIGFFNEVESLINPESQSMREEIEKLFAEGKEGDLLLLFFSGHGLTDERGRLYLAASNTRNGNQDELIRSTTIEASFIQEILKSSRSKQKIIILDCCFSGAFSAGMSVKGNSLVNIQEQLSGDKGSAILTSSSSTEPSFYQDNYSLSTYTHFIVQGLKTGLADRDKDGWIDPNDLHGYLKEKLQ